MRGYNRAARLARGDLLVVLQDDDLQPADGAYVARFVTLFDRYPSLGAIGTMSYRMCMDGACWGCCALVQRGVTAGSSEFLQVVLRLCYMSGCCTCGKVHMYAWQQVQSTTLECEGHDFVCRGVEPAAAQVCDVWGLEKLPRVTTCKTPLFPALMLCIFCPTLSRVAVDCLLCTLIPFVSRRLCCTAPCCRAAVLPVPADTCMHRRSGGQPPARWAWLMLDRRGAKCIAFRRCFPGVLSVTFAFAMLFVAGGCWQWQMLWLTGQASWQPSSFASFRCGQHVCPGLNPRAACRVIGLCRAHLLCQCAEDLPFVTHDNIRFHFAE